MPNDPFIIRKPVRLALIVCAVVCPLSLVGNFVAILADPGARVPGPALWFLGVLGFPAILAFLGVGLVLNGRMFFWILCCALVAHLACLHEIMAAISAPGFGAVETRCRIALAANCASGALLLISSIWGWCRYAARVMARR